MASARMPSRRSGEPGSAALRKRPNCRVFEALWLVPCQGTASQPRDLLVPFIDSNDGLIAAAFTQDVGGEQRTRARPRA